MGNRKKSRFDRMARVKAKLGVRKKLVDRTETMEVTTCINT